MNPSPPPANYQTAEVSLHGCILRPDCQGCSEKRIQEELKAMEKEYSPGTTIRRKQIAGIEDLKEFAIGRWPKVKTCARGSTLVDSPVVNLTIPDDFSRTEVVKPAHQDSHISPKETRFAAGVRTMKRLLFALFTCCFVAALALSPTPVQATYPVGYKLYHNAQGVAYVGHHYEWRLDKYGCGYWYKVVDPVAQYTAAPVTQYIINLPAYQAPANRGDTKYGAVTFTENISSYGNPDTALTLLGELTKSSLDALKPIADKRLALSQQSLNDQVDLLKEQLKNERDRNAALAANDRLEKLALIAKVTEAPASVSIQRNYNAASGEGQMWNQPAPQPAPQPVKPVQPNPGMDPAFKTAEEKCQRCHSEATAAQMGKGSVMPKFAEATKDQWDAMLIQISRTDDKNCAKKAGLTLEEVSAMQKAPKPN